MAKINYAFEKRRKEMEKKRKKEEKLKKEIKMELETNPVFNIYGFIS